ncbi:hypothetical protein CPB83DRAFT_795998 [Crepidotus variabilis]|uniref:Uncharacterized protein n=1 Tax=Crepidotus variabilis TaxID=179855 RepID=A0A9P6JM09_9AGAR|nr:hypothetical protein CPB83DRAFT_795998 [Crepidotus variabilis]
MGWVFHGSFNSSPLFSVYFLECELSSQSTMCKDEVYGDWYRGCSHFVASFESGNRIDCNDPYCGLSSAHIHNAPNCPCPRVTGEHRRIQNMFHKACEQCRTAEFNRRVTSG